MAGKLKVVRFVANVQVQVFRCFFCVQNSLKCKRWQWVLMEIKNERTQGISVVTTTWNERENIKDLILRVRSALRGFPHEIVVVDDSSSDGTLDVAKRFADLAVGKTREGQTKGLLYGMKLAKFPIVVTIDADLENNPDSITLLVEKLSEFDLVVASRTVLPRISERLASKTLGKMFGVSDFFSNFRVYKKAAITNYLRGGETFGGELLVAAKKNGCKIGEVLYKPPPRRSTPRIGGKIIANLRIIAALFKCFMIYLAWDFMQFM
jgi:dolichol-phosphate mannosyltransferase